jgi:anti-sigma B factor antagonist
LSHRDSYAAQDKCKASRDAGSLFSSRLLRPDTSAAPRYPTSDCNALSSVLSFGEGFPEVTVKLTTKTREVGAVTIVEISGRIVAGPESELLRDTISGLLTNGRKQILLNMLGVDHIDSRGLGDLVGILASVRNQGGDMKLVSVNSRVANIMEITRLYQVFDTPNSEEQGLTAFAASDPNR